MATTRARERVAQLLGHESACWISDERDGCAPGATAVVLDGVLALGEQGRLQLEDVLASLAPHGVLVAAVACARSRPRLVEAIGRGASPGTPVGFTRRSLLDQFDGAGWDVAALELIRDHSVAWVPLPLASTAALDIGPAVLHNLTADDIEELTAEAFVLVARRPTAVAPVCTVVVPTCGEVELTRACIEALLDAAPVARHEIVVIDDGSRDSTSAYLAGLGAQIRVVRNEEPAGFAAAANRGIRAATGEFVMIVHNDCVLAVGALDALVDVMRMRPGAGAAGPKLVAADRTLAAAGLAIGPELLPYPLYRGRRFDAPEASRLREVPAVSSACLITRRRWLVEVGGFDEALGGFEDADLCLRLRARHRPVVYCPSAVVVHREGGTPGPRTLLQDAAYFREKWAGQLVADDVDVCRDDGTDVRRVRCTGWYMPRRGRVPVDPGGPPAVLLSGQVFGRSGYANETRALARALGRAGVVVRANPFGWPLEDDEAQDMWSLATEELPRDFVHLCTFVALQLHRHPWALANIGRTMWETDLVPPERLEKCLQMDEIWVPGQQQLELFAGSGFPRERLVALPETFDEGLYDEPVPPAAIEGASGFVFLSVFAWTRRKGWDLLVRAYVEEFGPSEDVTLVLAYRQITGTPDDEPLNELRDLVLRRLGRSLAACPRIVFLPLDLPAAAMPSLYAAADAFVLPSRGEGWGRPLMEAMASGLPTIGTRWSGNLEFMSEENSFLIDCELVDVPEDGWHEWADYRGQRWAEPSVADLRATMRRVIDDPGEARTRAERGRSEVHARFGPRTVGRLFADRLRAVASH